MPDNFLDFITLGMGNVRSKPKGRFGRTKKDSSNYSNGERDAKTSGHGSKDFSAEIRERFAEDEELKKLRHDIQYNPELFILNNLMMSVQFFENFDEEITNIRDSVSSRETGINSCLPSPNRTYIPDVLQQHVGRKIKFTRIDPKLRLTIGLLHPIRIYVEFENIEVTEENCPCTYASVDPQITYYMQLKPSPSRKGYVLLRRLDESPLRKTKSVENLDLPSNRTRDEIYSDGDSLYGGKSNASESSTVRRLDKNLDSNDDQSFYGAQYGSQENMFDYPSTSRGKDDGIYGISTTKSMDPHRNSSKNHNGQYGKGKLLPSINGSLAGSTSSGYRSGNYSDSDTYSRTMYNTPKTSKSSLGSVSIISGSEIPRQCFRKIEYDGDGKIYVARRDKNRKLNSRDEQLRRYLKSKNYTLCFLNSTKFMKNFCLLFTDRLAEQMGFVIQNDFVKNEFQRGMICQTRWEYLKDSRSTQIEEFEIVPSVISDWPELAHEWLDRPRTTWPSYKIIENVKKTRCHMIPQGIILDKPDRYSDLEWQLVFPAAERYLETCLTSPQLKVYLIALMLQKTFMRPADCNFGLAVTHIKHMLFWLVEDDNRSSKWMENRTGESLMNLLHALYHSIRQDTPNLPDYFIKDRNLFQDMPGLHFTQKQLNRIIENPVMYVFHAMENIRQYRDSFPRLNFEELFKILTFPAVTLAHPALAEYVARSGAKTNGKEDDSEPVGFWDKNYQMDSEKQKSYSRKEVKKNLVNPKRQASDQVIEISVRIERMEPQRLSSLLDFFIRHFIKMAESCHNNRALPQKVAYVDHAERLSILLSEYPNHKDTAQTYLQKLYSLKRRVARSRSQNAPPTPPPNPPETPKRNADKAIFVSSLHNRYERPQDIEKPQQFLQLPVNGETIEYELESARSSVSNLQTPSEPQKLQETVTVMINHEENTEEVQLENSNEVSPTTDEEKKSSSKVKRVVSIANTKEESFLSETKL